MYLKKVTWFSFLSSENSEKIYIPIVNIFNQDRQNKFSVDQMKLRLERSEGREFDRRDVYEALNQLAVWGNLERSEIDINRIKTIEQLYSVDRNEYRLSANGLLALKHLEAVEEEEKNRQSVQFETRIYQKFQDALSALNDKSKSITDRSQALMDVLKEFNDLELNAENYIHKIGSKDLEDLNNFESFKDAKAEYREFLEGVVEVIEKSELHRELRKLKNLCGREERREELKKILLKHAEQINEEIFSVNGKASTKDIANETYQKLRYMINWFSEINFGFDNVLERTKAIQNIIEQAEKSIRRQEEKSQDKNIFKHLVNTIVAGNHADDIRKREGSSLEKARELAIFMHGVGKIPHSSFNSGELDEKESLLKQNLSLEYREDEKRTVVSRKKTRAVTKKSESKAVTKSDEKREEENSHVLELKKMINEKGEIKIDENCKELSKEALILIVKEIDNNRFESGPSKHLYGLRIYGVKVHDNKEKVNVKIKDEEGVRVKLHPITIYTRKGGAVNDK